MYLSKSPILEKEKPLTQCAKNGHLFFFFFPFFFFVPGWVENGFWLEGFGGGTRRVVILLFFRWSGVVGYRLVYFFGRSRSVPGTGERRRMERGAKARGNRCVTRMGSWPVYYYHHHFIFLYFYISIYLYIYIYIFWFIVK